MKPAITAGGFATETKDKVAEGIFLIRQSYVKEEDMLIASGVRILNGVPYRKLRRMHEGIGLTSIGSIP